MSVDEQLQAAMGVVRGQKPRRLYVFRDFDSTDLLNASQACVAAPELNDAAEAGA